MENASKALIIAGAILLSILLVSVGMMVYRNAKNNIGSGNIDKQDIEAFNLEWENYEGTGKTADEVRGMVQAVIASNAAESKNGKARYISVQNTAFTDTKFKTSGTKPAVQSASVNNATTYTISLGYDETTGLVCAISYVKPGTTTTSK